jgi:ribosomal protein S27AE
MNFEAIAQARWICLKCDCQRLGDDLLVAVSPSEIVVVGAYEETEAKHVYDFTDQELDENRLRCPNCGSAELRVLEQV